MTLPEKGFRGFRVVSGLGFRIYSLGFRKLQLGFFDIGLGIQGSVGEAHGKGETENTL